MTTEGTGLASPSPSVQQANRDALAAMDAHMAAANRNVTVGDTGIDYFHGDVTVITTSIYVVTIRDVAGVSYHMSRRFWMGLIPQKITKDVL